MQRESGSPSRKTLQKNPVIIGIGAFVLVVVVVLLMTYFVSKSAADSLAAAYQQKMEAYIPSLSSTNGKTIKGDLQHTPKLEGAAFSFLSTDYQKQNAKQAALNEDLQLIKAVSDAYTYKENDIRRTLFYDQSAFFFERFSARNDTYMKATGKEMSDSAYSKVVAKQYDGEAKAAKKYLKGLQKPVVQPVHSSEISKLKSVLGEFIKKAESCAKAATQNPAAAKDQAIDCNKRLNRYYYDTLIHYDFVAIFPYSLDNVKPMNILLASLKHHQADSYTGASVDKARLQAIIDTRVALIKALLPTSIKDKQFGAKADIVRAFNQQISEAISSAQLSAEEKRSYGTKLAIPVISLTMYDNPAGKKGPDDAGGFVGELAGILSASDETRNKDEASRYYPRYSERLKKLKELKTPEYVKQEMVRIVAVYESSLKYFKDADELDKKSKEATKRADEKTGSFDAVSEAINAYKYFNESNTKLSQGKAVLDKANSTVSNIGKKIDDTAAMTKQVTKQYDDLLAVADRH